MNLLSVMSWLAVCVGPVQPAAQPNTQPATQPSTKASTASQEASPAHAHDPERAPMSPVEPLRVGGDMNVSVEPDGPFFRSGAEADAVVTDEHLPEGYPRPTPPGAIEIKQYPPVRRAVVNLDARPGSGRNFAFWPLFNHISRRGIAMTTPVEMDVPSLTPADEQPSKEQLDSIRNWSMAFLYRTPDLGPTGKDGVVEVVDQPGMSVLALGLKGDYWPRNISEHLATLESWLASQTKWKAVGGARILAYNGPNIPASRRWGEIQVPIVLAQADASDSTPAPDAKLTPVSATPPTKSPEQAD